MMDQPNALETAGFFLCGGKIKGALLSYKKGAFLLDGLVDVNPLYLSDSMEDKKERLVVTCLETQETLFRPLSLKLKKDKDINATLPFQAEPLLPYPIENAQLDWFPLSEKKEGREIMVAAVRKDHLKRHLDTWSAFQKESEIVTSAPMALMAFAAHFVEEEEPFYVLDIGEELLTCLLIEKKRMLAVQSARYKKEDISLEAMKLFYALAKQVKDKESEKVLVTGDCQRDLDLKKQRIEIKEDKGFAASASELLSYAIPIGLALLGLPKALPSLNFRSGEFSFPHPWKRFKRPALLYAVSCLSIACALYFFGSAYLEYKKDEVKEDFVSLLAFMNKPYLLFEAEYEVKNPFRLPLEEGNVASLEQLNEEEIAERVQFLETEIRNAPEMFALLPNVPRVSDVLAWLTTHPQVSKVDEKTGEVKPLIEIENFSYTMVSRPEEKKRSNRYQVKVEIEFTSPTPMLARAFHDALIAPNDFVDPKSEVKWSATRGKYKTAFLLKDKTVYPALQKGVLGNE